LIKNTRCTKGAQAKVNGGKRIHYLYNGQKEGEMKKSNSKSFKIKALLRDVRAKSRRK